MANSMIDRRLYDAIEDFPFSEAAQDYFYKVMDAEVAPGNTVRDRILRVYAMLFCDDMDLEPGHRATFEEVEATADRLYSGAMGLDPRHWYRMRHHFPVIDEDNYDRFAALVISDLKAGPLRDAAVNDGEMLIVGEADPLHMTPEQRANQRVRRIEPGRLLP